MMTKVVTTLMVMAVVMTIMVVSDDTDGDGNGNDDNGGDDTDGDDNGDDDNGDCDGCDDDVVYPHVARGRTIRTRVDAIAHRPHRPDRPRLNQCRVQTFRSQPWPRRRSCVDASPRP